MNVAARKTTDRLVELLLAAALIALPTRVHWSRRSSRLLSLAGLVLVVGGIRVGPASRPLPGLPGTLARKRSALVGFGLIGSQYLLSEETSTVQGVIAGIGAILVLFGLLTHRIGDHSSGTAENA